jgi:hypothetical protein
MLLSGEIALTQALDIGLVKRKEFQAPSGKPQNPKQVPNRGV